jgi:hypothetical protein
MESKSGERGYNPLVDFRRASLAILSGGTMATGIVRRSYHAYDNVFFPAMAGLFLVFVFIGFAPTYYLAGLFRAPLPNLLVHIHGAVFSAWILLLITQTSLVDGSRVDVHRRLGMLGFGLACLMVVLGLLVSADRHLRGPLPIPARRRSKK